MTVDIFNGLNDISMRMKARAQEAFRLVLRLPEDAWAFERIMEKIERLKALAGRP